MITLKRLKQSRAARNAAASYFAFFSFAACAFISIPLAVHYLDKSEIGLWAVVNAVVSYLLWMDLGVGNATGRKMADAVARHDQSEIDQWWTLTRAALMVQGFMMILLGFGLVPLILQFFRIPADLAQNAQLLLGGAILIAGLSLPLRGVDGLMTAQERFHWIPLGQGLFPWIRLVVFATLLHSGFGIKAYIFAMAITQLVTWIYYSILVRTGPMVPGWNRMGLSRSRFRSLFGFSINLSAIGLMDAVISSLPAMILARIGGLAEVPRYTFSSKGPSLITSLVRRTLHSFYPSLQKLYVTGERDRFRAKFQSVGILTLAIGLIAAGGVIACNRTLVELLAGPDYFAGSQPTAWFAVGVISVPLYALFVCLRQISGSMGKTALVAFTKLGIASALAFPLYKQFGLTGLAAVFALTPLIDVIYGYFKGSKGCGFSPKLLSGRIIIAAIAMMTGVLALGLLVPPDSKGGIPFAISTRTIYLPNSTELGVGCFLSFIGIILALRHLRALRDS
jgi:O-antigen/teichoic acid export membrane protein